MTAIKAADVGEIIPINRPPVAPADPFGALAPHTLDKMRTIVARVQELGLPLEVHPQMADTFSFAMDGALYSVSAVGPKEELVVTVQGRIGAITYEDLLNILPDGEGGVAAPPPPRLSPLPPPKRHQADILEDILSELKAIRAML